jgi:hypothetical protein
MNQNIFMFMQENQLTNYSKEGGDRISVTPLYKIPWPINFSIPILIYKKEFVGKIRDEMMNSLEFGI